jgi:hypothetical protein
MRRIVAFLDNESLALTACEEAGAVGEDVPGTAGEDVAGTDGRSARHP